jgi:4-hydroxybenzoate polyprenyltransferase|tara:strand:+ start:291 stop:1175 length:885 start_codon:yes stop_codon:yes gene_type:complete
VAISQFLIYWVYIIPLFDGQDIVLSGSLWWLFIIDTVLIAAAGYVINDIIDQKADQLNKPTRLYLGPSHLSEKSVWFYFGFLVLVGFMIALYIAYSIEKIHLLLIYPTAVGLLYLYSKSFKKLPLIGNLVVAIFCAFVPGIILYAEWDVLEVAKVSSPSEYEFIFGMFLSYLTFAFLSSLIRELVKDIEDIEGDKLVGYKTYPVVYGEKKAKVLCINVCLVLIISYGLWFLPFIAADFLGIIVGLISAIFFFSLFILHRMIHANEKQDFSTISKWLKILMVLSLFVFLCIPFFT